MKIRVNGEDREVSEGLILAGLLAELGIDRARVAVERNRAFVRKVEFESVVLIEGDEIEVVTLVGGG